MKNNITPEQIDAVLPQTQCGLCGYNGCMPYAQALIHSEAAINLCPPGGVKGLKDIANLLNKNPAPFIAEMEQKTKPTLLAVIREAECIGCTKCIQACPVDAILGSAKQMHTVIAKECTGCELCVTPCPVDCIDMIAITEKPDALMTQQANIARERHRSRQQRLTQQVKATLPRLSTTSLSKSIDEKKVFIQAAILRAKIKKNGDKTGT